ncbi:PaaI family thioesterase [Microbacterium sp. NPDC055357]
MNKEQAASPRFGQSSGLEYQRAIAEGRIERQPFQTLIGFSLTRVDDDGTAEAKVVPRPEFCNAAGRLHGGYLSAVLDCITATVAHSTQPAESAAPHMHAAYRFVRAVTADAPLIATATITVRSRSIVHVHGELLDERGRLIASGETIHKIRRMRDSVTPDSDA